MKQGITPSDGCELERRPDAEVWNALMKTIGSDAEILKLLSRKPGLVSTLGEMAWQYETLSEIRQEYLRETDRGFRELFKTLVLWEVATDATGLPLRGASGKFSSLHMNANGQFLMDRFMGWVRETYLWPCVLDHAKEVSTTDPKEGRRIADAVALVMAVLGERSAAEPAKTGDSEIDMGEPRNIFLM